MNRIASLVSAATETVCALGLADALVGRSEACRFPPEVAGLPALLSLDGVLDAELCGIRPSHVIVDPADGTRVRRALADGGVAPVVVEVATASLGDVWAGFLRVADALGIPEQGLAMADRLSRGLTEVGEKALAAGARPRVACLVGASGAVTTPGRWVPELLTLAGAQDALALPASRPAPVDAEALRDADPDVLLWVEAPGEDEAPAGSGWDAWPSLRAIEAGRAYRVGAEVPLLAPGPRLVDAVRHLAALLHPDAFPAPR